jgi:hypothetical protein
MSGAITTRAIPFIPASPPLIVARAPFIEIRFRGDRKRRILAA